MIKIAFTSDGPLEAIRPRAFNVIKRRGYKYIGVFWHKRMRRRHFTKRGGRDYDYAPREGEPGNPGGRGVRNTYTGRKLKMWGHTRPLVFSGLTRALSKIRDVRPTAKGVRIVMNLPTLNLRRHLDSPPMREEMTRVSPGELTELGKMFAEHVDRNLARRGKSRPVKI